MAADAGDANEHDQPSGGYGLLLIVSIMVAAGVAGILLLSI
jgi:hypothetical protein